MTRTASTCSSRSASPLARSSDAERIVADAALTVVTNRFGGPLYARVDLLPAPVGPVVVEVEVTEPSLFLSYSPGAAERFAAAIAARA